MFGMLGEQKSIMQDMRLTDHRRCMGKQSLWLCVNGVFCEFLTHRPHNSTIARSVKFPEQNGKQREPRKSSCINNPINVKLWKMIVLDASSRCQLSCLYTCSGWTKRVREREKNVRLPKRFMLVAANLQRRGLGLPLGHS